MAYKDLRASLVTLQGTSTDPDAKLMAEIQQVFFEVALEMGLTGTEFLPEGRHAEDGSVLVYAQQLTGLLRYNLHLA